MKSTLITVIACLFCLAGIAAWFFTAPQEGSGWILLVTFLGILGLRNSVHSVPLAAAAGTLLTLSAGAAWWLNRSVEDSGWVLFLCLICALGTFNALNQLAARQQP